MANEPDKPASIVSVSDNEPAPEWGPAMRSLRPIQRRAVLALFQTRGNRTEAMRMAGYGQTGKKSYNSLKNHGYSFFQQDRVRAAVREVAEREIAICEPELSALTWDIARDTALSPRDRLRAVSMVWDRSNPVIQKHQVQVGVHLTADELDMNHYRALKKLNAPEQAYLDRFGIHGLPRVKELVEAEDAKHRRNDAEGAIETDYTEVLPDE